MTNDLNTAQFTPCGKVRRTRDKNDDSFVFINIDGCFVPFRANSPQLDLHVGEDLYTITNDNENDELSLVGLQVRDTEQGLLGIITAVDDTTANTLIELDNGTLLPLHEDFINELTDDTLVITLPFVLNDGK